MVDPVDHGPEPGVDVFLPRFLQHVIRRIEYLEIKQENIETRILTNSGAAMEFYRQTRPVSCQKVLLPKSAASDTFWQPRAKKCCLSKSAAVVSEDLRNPLGSQKPVVIASNRTGQYVENKTRMEKTLGSSRQAI